MLSFIFIFLWCVLAIFLYVLDEIMFFSHDFFLFDVFYFNPLYTEITSKSSINRRNSKDKTRKNEIFYINSSKFSGFFLHFDLKNRL
jgi:hypothetical protein